MAFDAEKTILLEKQYLYVRASKGFVLEGTSTERIWTNTGYYRFLVANVASSLGNSYVTIHYDASDIDFIAYCSDLFMEEIQNSVTTAVENIEAVLNNFAEQNHEDVDTLSTGLSNALQIVVRELEGRIYSLNEIDFFRRFSSGGSNFDIPSDLNIGQRYRLLFVSTGYAYGTSYQNRVTAPSDGKIYRVSSGGNDFYISNGGQLVFGFPCLIEIVCLGDYPA